MTTKSKPAKKCRFPEMFLRAERTVEYLAEAVRIEFGEEVYRIGFDKKRLAKRLGVPVSAIPKILGGDDLSLETMVAIADELGMTVSVKLEHKYRSKKKRPTQE